MKKYMCLIAALIIISSCTKGEGDDSMPPLKVETLGEYEWDFSLKGAVGGMPDTLFMTALGGDAEYSFMVRRKVYEDGIFSGRYAYTKAEDISCSEAKSFHPTLRAEDGKEAVTLCISAEEWTDFRAPRIEQLKLSVGKSSLTIPIKQEAATFERLGEHIILHTGMEEKIIYLDHKGDTVDFQTAYAVQYSLNGKKDDDTYWCEEDATFSFALSDSTWIRVIGVEEREPGIFNLRIATVPDPERGTHDATLTLSFIWNGKLYSKEVALQSTQVFHVEIID